MTRTPRSPRSSTDPAERGQTDSDGTASPDGAQCGLPGNQNSASNSISALSSISPDEAAAVPTIAPSAVNEVSVLLPSNSTLRLRPRRRARSNAIVGPGPIPQIPTSTSTCSTGTAPSPALSAPSPGSASFADSTDQTSSETGGASPAWADQLPRNGRPLVGIRAKYKPGGLNGFPAPDVLANNIIALATVSTAGPQTLEEIDAISAEAAANAEASTNATNVATQPNGTSTSTRPRARSVRFDDESARSIIANFRATPENSPPSPPKPSPRRRLSLPSFQEPDGLHCPGRDELRSNRRASDPGLPGLRDIMMRRLFRSANDNASSPTDVDRNEVAEAQTAEHNGIAPQSALDDIQDAVMITPRRRNRLRRSPLIDPVLEVDESRETPPRWALDFDNFINGLEDQDDDDSAEEDEDEDEDKADSFSEINESVGH